MSKAARYLAAVPVFPEAFAFLALGAFSSEAAHRARQSAS